MSDLSLIQSVLSQQVQGVEDFDATMTLFVYRFIASETQTAINYSELASLLKVDFKSDPDFDHLLSMFQSIKASAEAKRFNLLSNWHTRGLFKQKLKSTITYLFENPDRLKRSDELFQLVESTLCNGVTVIQILHLLQTEYSRCFPSQQRLSGAIMAPDIVLEITKMHRGCSRMASVFDPACKSGDLLAAASDGVPKSSIRVSGIEEGGPVIFIAEARLKGEALDYDLSNELEDQNESFKADKFDFVVCNPPFGSLKASEWRRKIAYRFGAEAAQRSELAHLMLGLSKLSANGRATYILPATVLKSERYIELRGRLIDDYGLCSVVLLPDNIFQHSKVSTCVVLFDRSTRHDSIYFIDSTSLADKSTQDNHFSDSSLQTVINYAHKRSANIKGVGKLVAVKEVLQQKSILYPKFYLRVSHADPIIKERQLIKLRYHELITEFEELTDEMEFICDQLSEEEFHD